jgi:AbrB family looped-hinge helix DNA binding protein
MNAIVAERGQVTIPQKLRQRLGIRPRTILDFFEEDGRLIGIKITRKDPVERAFGRLKLSRNVDSIVAELRGDK